MNGKLRIERPHPDDLPASEQPHPSPELVPPRPLASSIRPYFYRVPKGPRPPAGETPLNQRQGQRRSTDDDPPGPRSR
jgi:hypothetical protein